MNLFWSRIIHIVFFFTWSGSDTATTSRECRISLKLLISQLSHYCSLFNVLNTFSPRVNLNYNEICDLFPRSYEAFKRSNFCFLIVEKLLYGVYYHQYCQFEIVIPAIKTLYIATGSFSAVLFYLYIHVKPSIKQLSFFSLLVKYNPYIKI